MRSELSAAKVETTLEIASGSAGRGLGRVICHLESLRCKWTVSPARCLISISRNWSSGMFTSFVEVLSRVDFSALAAFLFDHQTAALSASKRRQAVKRPLDFMGYRRLHQVIRPNPMTASGNTTTLSQNVAFSLPLVILSGRSEGAFGRMEIRSSSDESQFTMLTIKSLFPSERDPTMPFCAASEVPRTTKRP